MTAIYDEQRRLDLDSANETELRAEMACCEIWIGTELNMQAAVEPNFGQKRGALLGLLAAVVSEGADDDAKIRKRFLGSTRAETEAKTSMIAQSSMMSPEELQYSLSQIAAISLDDLKHMLAESPYYTQDLTPVQIRSMDRIRKKYELDPAGAFADYDTYYRMAIEALNDGPMRNGPGGLN